jgi:hypothetical protein
LHHAAIIAFPRNANAARTVPSQGIATRHEKRHEKHHDAGGLQDQPGGGNA